MSNALQIDFLAAGVVDSDGVALASGKVYTYAAGTTTDKSVYTDAAMTTPAANPVVLNAAGVANVYGFGNYKFAIYTSADVLVRTLDNQYYTIPDYTPIDVVDVSADYTADNVNQVMKVNTGSGNITVTLPTAVGNEGVRISILKTSASNTLTIDGNGSETINGSTTQTITANNGVMEIISDNANWVIINSNTAGTVTLTGAQTLENKSVIDSTFYIKDNADATKILQIQCSGITTGTTRTMTVPDADFTAVGLATTQTLTNKTLTAPTLTSATLTGVADIYTTAWTDFSSSVSITGFSGSPTVSYIYMVIGKLVYCVINISGTSNSTSFTFTLPVATSSSFPAINVVSLIRDNGTWAFGSIALPNNNTLVGVNSTASSASWTNSGAKACVGQFFYRIA